MAMSKPPDLEKGPSDLKMLKFLKEIERFPSNQVSEKAKISKSLIIFFKKSFLLRSLWQFYWKIFSLLTESFFESYEVEWLIEWDSLFRRIF